MQKVNSLSKTIAYEVMLMGIDLLPAFLAGLWNVPIYAVQGALTGLIIMLLILPVVILGGKDDGSTYLEVVFSYIGVFVSAGLGWLDPGVFIVFTLGLTGIVALVMGDVLGG